MDLNQVSLPSTNMKKSIEFYTKLGLQLIVSSSEAYSRFDLPDGNSTFSLSLVDEIPTAQLAKVYFEVPNLDLYYSELVSQGIGFISKPEIKIWLWKEAQLEDPDGNVIIIFEASENRKNPPWRIN